MEEQIREERIGKVRLDLSRYEGVDRYSDGSVEDEILRIVTERAPGEYAEAIEQSRSWPVLYHLSPLRENIAEWLPIGKGDRVLDVGSGCGAVTGAFARKAGEVTCVDLSLRRSRINAHRHRDFDNLTIRVGNFREIEPELARDYDWICLIGVFEYGAAYIGGDAPYEEFLRILKKHLAPNGRIVIAIENRFGLKYFAGCREDHLGTFFEGIEGYPRGGAARTFTQEGLLRIAERCGISRRSCHLYYPYPDYKFMHTLFSERRLPKVGECKDNLRNFDADRLELFGEKQAFDTIIGEGEFPLFSNSYLLLIGPETDLVYARYSNDRESGASICTELYADVRAGSGAGGGPGLEALEETAPGRPVSAQGTFRVTKRALSGESEGHLRRMKENLALLQERYRGGELRFAECELCSGTGKEGGPAFPYLTFSFAQGTSLEELLDERLAGGDVDGFHRLFREYVRRISYGEEREVTDYDLIFSNILVDGEAWTVIDYEWVFPERTDSRRIAWRALYCYLLEDASRQACRPEALLEELGITQELQERFQGEEMEFQKRVTGDHLSLGEIRERIGNPVYTLGELLGKAQGGKADALRRLEVFEDRGGGFLAEEVSHPERLAESAGENGVSGRYRIRITPIARIVRIDPGSEACFVTLRRLCWNGEELSPEFLEPAGGMRLAKGVFVFAGNDPQLMLDLERLPRTPEDLLEIELAVTQLTRETAESLAQDDKSW